MGKEKQKKNEEITPQTLFTMSKGNFAHWSGANQLADAEMNDESSSQTDADLLNTLEYIANQSYQYERMKHEVEFARFMGFLFLVALVLSVAYPLLRYEGKLPDLFSSMVPFMLTVSVFFVSLETKRNLIDYGLFGLNELRERRIRRKKHIQDLLLTLRLSPEYVAENTDDIIRGMAANRNIPYVDLSREGQKSEELQRWLAAVSHLNNSNESQNDDPLSIEDLQQDFL